MSETIPSPFTSPTSVDDAISLPADELDEEELRPSTRSGFI